MRVYTNGGHQDYDKVGDVKLFPFEAYYNPNSMANILSLKEVANKFRITMDTVKERAMCIHIDKHRVLKFTECLEGLYYFDTSTIANNDTNTNVVGYSFLNTVKANKDFFPSFGYREGR